MQTYYTGEDIEDLAARGIRSLELRPGVVLTDIARELANELGIELVNANAAQPTPTAAPPRQTASASLPPLGAKPRGCQHGPIQTSSPSNNGQGASSNNKGVVNRLVDVVSRMTDRGS